MEKITSVTELKARIVLLEIKQVNDKKLLKEEFKTTYESLRPVNLIKKTISELTTSADFKGDILNTVLSVAVGYLTKKAAVGGTRSPVKKILGTILQMGVTNVVSKNSEEIKSVIKSLLTKFLRKKDVATEETTS
jgi:hypothetical protein